MNKIFTFIYKLKSIFALFFCIGVFFGCSINKYIPEDERVYTGADLTIETDTIVKNENLLKDELEEVLIPKSNSKFLGMYPSLYFYYKNQKENPDFINKWLYKRFGENPVYQSDVEPYEVEKLLLNRLENRGFFYSRANSEIIEKEKRASVNYTVNVSKPYTMASYNLDTLPQPIYDEIKESIQNTQFKEGMRFDLSNMKLERLRIDNDLKNKGYYNFNEGFLIFEADTNQYKKKKYNLFLRLKKEVPEKAIVPYKLSKINVYANYSIETDSSITDVTTYENKNFIQKELFFKPSRLSPFITLQKGQYYNPETSRNTARRLSTIGSYKYVNIKYKEIDSLSTDSLGYLETDIYLSPLNKRAIRAELQGVTKSNNFAGPVLALTFTNRNLFKGGEILNISTNIGYETQLASGSNKGLSSIELGLKGELIFPRMVFPIKINEDFFQYAIPKTKTSLGLDYLSRTKLYTLLSATALYGYSWNANRFITHQINPISVNYTKLSNTTPEFQQILDDNPFLKSSFNQKFIAGLTYAFTYNGMVDSQSKHQIFFNSTVDIAGNRISLFDKSQGGNEPNTFLGLEYAQYAKADIDVHYHLKLGKNQNQTLATRLFAGYGYAYGNSNIMPYVKQYFSGGPYSVRAFQTRSLGPGTYNGDNNNDAFFDQTGNIKLEANIEYRFPMFSFVNGAFFADAGNVWNSKENTSLPGGKFSGNFLNELGMGAGFGLRIDIQGFVIRLDLAAPFHEPSDAGTYKFDFDSPVLNFAVGYPF